MANFILENDDKKAPEEYVTSMSQNFPCKGKSEETSSLS